MNTINYVACPDCGYAIPESYAGKFCSQCGHSSNSQTGKTYQAEGHADAFHPGNSYRPHDEDWTDYWSNQPPAGDDFAAFLAGLLMLGLAGIGAYTVVKSLKNSHRQIEGE